jgi:hypothetical protein
MSRSRPQLNIAIQIMLAGVLALLLLPNMQTAHATSSSPPPPGAYHVHYICSDCPGTAQQFPSPQSGMTCWTQYFCVDASAPSGVREVSQPVATEACYDTIEEAFAAIGIAYNCSVTVGAGAAPGTYSRTCPGGLVVSVTVSGTPTTQSPRPPSVRAIRRRAWVVSHILQWL